MPTCLVSSIHRSQRSQLPRTPLHLSRCGVPANSWKTGSVSLTSASKSSKSWKLAGSCRKTCTNHGIRGYCPKYGRRPGRSVSFFCHYAIIPKLNLDALSHSKYSSIWLTQYHIRDWVLDVRRPDGARKLEAPASGPLGAHSTAASNVAPVPHPAGAPREELSLAFAVDLLDRCERRSAALAAAEAREEREKLRSALLGRLGWPVAGAHRPERERRLGRETVCHAESTEDSAVGPFKFTAEKAPAKTPPRCVVAARSRASERLAV
eukprot:scaffold3970_cov257-Pinguiococcus_pyrenoidosus.AAC.11